MTVPPIDSDQLLAEARERDDQSALAILATTDPSARIRKLAAGLVRDQEVLNAIVANERNQFVAIPAVERITSDEDLKRIAWSDAHFSVRAAAAERLSDTGMLEEIVLRHPEDWVRAAAERRLRALAGDAVGAIASQEALRAVALHDPDPRVRAAAFLRLDASSLASLLRDATTPEDMRTAAIERVSDRALLADLAANDATTTVREAAAARLAELAADEAKQQRSLQHAESIRIEISPRGRPRMWGPPLDYGLGKVGSPGSGGILDDFTGRTRIPDDDIFENFRRASGGDAAPARGTTLPPELALPLPDPDAAAAPGDHVRCSVYAPPTLPRGATMMVQAFLHLPESAAEAEAQALEFDADARRRGFRSLAAPIARGTEVTFSLEVPALGVMNRVQQMVWTGETESVQFAVVAPLGAPLGATIAQLTLSVGSVPLGHISFKLEVTAVATQAPAQGLGEAAVLYRLIFVSYASEDRPEVLKRVQMLSVLKVDFFQDLLSLDPGERWERKLYEKIDECDLFLLFWSTAAKASKWVRAETLRAMERQRGANDAAPRIIPVIIEGPPPVPPPDELKALHFNDPILYFIEGSKRPAAPPA